MKSKPVKALTYSRVSTADKGQNPEVQAAELRRYCVAREWAITEEIVDHGYSGGTDQRPGLKRLMALVRSRKVDVVVVAKMDRLFRSLKHLVTTLDEFSALGVQFVSIGDQIDLTTAGGRLMLHLLGAFGEFERALIRERTMAGLAYARSQGKKLGRPITRPDDAILQLRSEGASYTAIQRKLGVSRPAIRRALLAAAAASTKTPKNQHGKTSSNRGGSHA
jgi:DNA invertase Pin-like site-specific DNA recombinase